MLFLIHRSKTLDGSMAFLHSTGRNRTICRAIESQPRNHSHNGILHRAGNWHPRLRLFSYLVFNSSTRATVADSTLQILCPFSILCEAECRTIHRASILYFYWINVENYMPNLRCRQTNMRKFAGNLVISLFTVSSRIPQHRRLLLVPSAIGANIKCRFICQQVRIQVNGNRPQV